MELWWHFRGWKRLRLVSADCAGRLRRISGEIKLADISMPDELTAEFTVSAARAKELMENHGKELTVVGGGGLPRVAQVLWRWRRLMLAILILGLLTMLLPGRVWFIRVEGNETVPSRLILERAEEGGVFFGARASAVRSEQVKNKLLYEIPELRWAGVNTSGCSAVITVAEREMPEPAEEERPGDLVAAADGVVTELILSRGTALVKPGDAVQAGQTLLSGATELGVCTRIVRAEGEIWGLTRREIKVSLPQTTMLRRETGALVRKFSLRIGKKSVNFSNDSGILYGTCVRMRTVKYLSLPGGFRLPVALVTDTYHLCETEQTPRGETDWFASVARRTVRGLIPGGQILKEDFAMEKNLLRAVFDCREQIGVFRPIEYMERDTFDRENGER